MTFIDSPHRSILITGASSGLGEGLALHYAAPGVHLALSGRDQARLKDVSAACRAKGAIVDAVALSVTDQGGMEQWIASVDANHPLDLVVANAGISGGTGGSSGGEDTSQARRIFDINLTGVLNTIDPAISCMMKRGRGQVAIMSSLAGFRGWPGAPAYSASKGAVRFYGEALRGALKDSGIRVNVICPGFVRTRMTAVNDFPMPLLMDQKQAVAIIVKGLAQDKGRIAFPFATHFAAWFISVLPDFLIQKFLILLPAKSAD